MHKMYSRCIYYDQFYAVTRINTHKTHTIVHCIYADDLMKMLLSSHINGGKISNAEEACTFSTFFTSIRILYTSNPTSLFRDETVVAVHTEQAYSTHETEQREEEEKNEPNNNNESKNNY